MKPDIVIELEYDMVNSSVKIRTNAKHDKVIDLLEDYLHAQVGTGVDPAPPAERDVYKITIGVELGEDIWGSSHDCGNKGLREGIIMRILQMLDKEPDRVTYID